ncbi:phosphate acetyltransferase [Desulfosarcina sp.]|nr:phosphate acetyltransferase [Desulfosarcina sp.]
MKEEFIANIKEKARKQKKKIIFPEGEEERVLQACKIIINEGIAEPVLVGNKEKIKWRIGELGYEAEVVDPNDYPDIENLSNKLLELRKHKGMTKEDADKLIKDKSYFSTMLLKEDYVDALVSGSTHTTGETLRPGLQIIRTEEDTKIASSVFIMLVNDKVYLFADCGLNIKPNAEELSEIAYSTMKSAKFFGIEPKVAFLSFSSKGSADHEDVKKVHNAVKLFKDKNPGCIFDGELQVDAAIVPDVAEKKAPNSPIKGDANVLIFPDLGAGNIAYKLVQRVAGGTALGPIIQGLKKPFNDLSRGCSVQDIVDVTAITAVQAQK